MDRKEDYDKKSLKILYKYRNFFWFRHRNRIILDIITKYFKHKKSIKILELGAGSGNISRYLKNSGYNMDVSDMYDEALKYFKYGGYNIFTFDLISDEVPVHLKHKYDLIILGDVIEHIDKPISVLKKIKDFLVLNGGILITVPALMQLYTPYDNFCGHKKRYNKNNLETELIDSNYHIEKTKYFMFIPAIILFFKRRYKSVVGNKEKFFEKEFAISSIANTIMSLIMTIEYVIGKVINYPFGSSLISFAWNK